MAIVRYERPADHASVYRINERAFEGPAEAQIVEELRKTATPAISLVATHEGKVLGHIFFSPVKVAGNQGEWEAIGLAPMAVDPGHQRQGIGSELVRSGLEACRYIQRPVVVVLGHPEYYPRFGFRPAAPLGLRYRDPSYDHAFFVVELTPGALRARSGDVRFMPAFDRFG